jgi:DNA helicase-2/ATP-dependent DNA helicase PcrA
VAITRARKRAKIFFATNRRMHGTWSSNIPSRFLDELPEEHVEVTESKGGGGFGMSGYGPSRFDEMASFGSSYGTPGWQRAQARGRGGSGFNEKRSGYSRPPLTIEGELVARSTGEASEYRVGDRIFHQKFGNGNVVGVDGNKLTIDFDKAGEKRVVDSFVERVG